MAIVKFSGEYEFLSNFASTPLIFRGKLYKTAEHAYQASKAKSDTEHELVRAAATPALAKKVGRHVSCREDWDEIKRDVMYEVLECKFQNPILADLLIGTGDEELVEGNTWGDQYWGVSSGFGENHLGQLLMKLREKLKKS